MSEELEYYDITPTTAMLIADAEQSHLSWLKALSELIDNSFDAGATSVTVEFDKNDLIISDNGSGCGNYSSMLTLGLSVKQRTTMLGRYGIGVKEALLWAGGVPSVVRIYSIHGGKKYNISFSWNELVSSGRWRLPRVAPLPVEPGDCGTRIMVHGLRRKVPEGEGWAKLLADLGYYYTPALKKQRQLLVKGKGKRDKVAVPVPLFKLPDLRPGYINRRIEVSGKTARVYAGIVAGEDNSRPGLTVMHGFRVIIDAPNNFGCGDYSNAKIAGFVDLDESWVLTKNKDDISEHREELGDEVFKACKDLLAVAAAESSSLRSSQFASALTQAIQSVMEEPAEKARRDRGDQSGSIKPSDGKHKHRKAAKTQPGNRFPATVPVNKISVELQHHPENDSGLGLVMAEGKHARIVLYDDHPAIAEMLSTGNHLAAMTSALMLLSNWCATTGGERGQLLLPVLADVDQSERFVKAISSLLADKRIREFRLPTNGASRKPQIAETAAA